MSNRFFFTLVVCLLGIAMLSNRAFPLRQSPVRIAQQISFHLPTERTGSSRVDHGPRLIAISDEGVFDLQQMPRNAMEIITIPASPTEMSWAHFRLQNFLHGILVYFLQPVLNL